MDWGRRAFGQFTMGGKPLREFIRTREARMTLKEALAVLDFVHIAYGLISAYGPDYPLVEPRELIPSFDAPLIEYKNLPAFSLVILDRPLRYQDEGFQFDILLPEGRPVDAKRVAHNRHIIRQRLPRDQVPKMDKDLGRKALTPFGRYLLLLPHLLNMDRGHVIAREQTGGFGTFGIFASFPSNLDGEIKRFGRQIGKFETGDDVLYAANRQFAYHFLMEQSGFPICGERHTSAALFARRLMSRKESFAVKVLGQSDRTVTTLTSLGARRGLPRVEKVALVRARDCSEESYRRLKKDGFWVDAKRRVVILRVHYRQHAYHRDNVLENRALSVARQEVVHPLTGETISLDVLGLGQDRLIMLNDIVRGEFGGTILYQGQEHLTDTADMKNRLMFLSAWLGKHRHILADYSPDNFERLCRILWSFSEDVDHQKKLKKYPGLVGEVKEALTELRLAHRLRLLEKLVQNRADASGRRLKHTHLLAILVHMLSQESPLLAQNHPQFLRKLVNLCRKELGNPYLKRRYLRQPPSSAEEREVVGQYKLLSRLVERLKIQVAVDSEGESR